MQAAHPQAFTGAFTYTAIHRASHYLGLAHPDSIGATRNPDGSPRYYDGFTWTYNTTARSRPYSHTELILHPRPGVDRTRPQRLLPEVDRRGAGGRGRRTCGRQDDPCRLCPARRRPAQGGHRQRQEGAGAVREVRLRERRLRRAVGLAQRRQVPRPGPQPARRHSELEKGTRLARRRGLPLRPPGKDFRSRATAQAEMQRPGPEPGRCVSGEVSENKHPSSERGRASMAKAERRARVHWEGSLAEGRGRPRAKAARFATLEMSW